MVAPLRRCLERLHHLEAAIDLVPDGDLGTEASRRRDDDVRGAVADRRAITDGGVQHRARLPCTMTALQDGPESLTEDGPVVVVRDGRGSAVVVDRRGCALGDHAPAQSGPRRDGEPLEVVGAGADELAEVECVVLDLAGEQDRRNAVSCDGAQLTT